MKKKVLAFIPGFPVLSETFIEREIAGLAKSPNIDLTVVAVKQGVGFREKFLAEYVQYRGGATLHLVEFAEGCALFLRKPANVFKAWRVVGAFRPYEFIKGFGYARVFWKYKPEVIYAHFLSKPSTVALVASILLDVPLVISAHARDVLEYPDLIAQKAKYAKFITFCNKNALNFVKSKVNVSLHSKLKLIYHGVDPKSLKLPQNPAFKKPSEPLIFTVARLEEKKGIKYLIEASEILKAKGVKHLMYVAGGGPLFGKLKDLVSSKNLTDSFTMLGETPFNKVLEYMHATDVYAQPSINAASGDADGIPNALIEAAMLKLPIVTTNAGSISDFLDLSNAIIISQKDSVKLAGAIEKLLGDKNLRDSLSSVAYEKALEVFDLNKSISEIENLLV